MNTDLQPNNFINKLLKGEKVEWKKLGEVCEIKRGKSITQKQATEGKYPVISGGQKPAYYINQYNRENETITIAGSGAYAGFVMYWNEPIFVGDAFSIKPIDELILSTRYIYHFLLNIQPKLFGLKSGSGVPHVYPKDVATLQIPLPPLHVQSRIVEILDKFTELEAKLEAELNCRKRQYEYYRNKLLNFSDLIGGGKNIVWKTLGEVFEIRNGYTPSKSQKEYWEGGTIPWYRMEDIRANGGILKDSIQHITEKGVKKTGLFKANSIIMATTATIGEHAMLIADSLANQRFTNFKVRKSLEHSLLPKYVYYYFFVIDHWCKQNVNVSNFPSVEIGRLKKYLFPIPPLAEQERIVHILDRFDTLINSITEGLPKEIAQRRKQYEYYRNQLLSFPHESYA